MKEEITEKQMVCGLKEGNHWFFETFVSEYGKMVHGICFKFLRNRHEVEDIAQDVFIKAYEKIDGFREQSKLSSWLYRITVNECMMHLRKESKRNFVHMTFYEKSHYFVPQKTPLTSLHNKQLKMSIMESIEKLNEKERKTLIMRIIEEKSNVEVASTLGISVSAAKSRYHRGKIKIQRGNAVNLM